MVGSLNLISTILSLKMVENKQEWFREDFIPLLNWKKNYFSSEIYKDRLDRYYTMHDNKLYGIVELGQGGDMSPDKYGLSISSETDNECVFIITNYYSNGEKFDSEHKITYQNGKWIFVDEFIENMY